MATNIINRFGSIQGWNSLTVNMLGRDLEGIKSLKYGDKDTKTNVYGAGKHPVGRSSGNVEPFASIGLLKEEVDALKQSLPPGMRIQDIPPFDIVAEYELRDGTIIKDRVRNCEFTNRGVDVKQSDGEIVTEYELIVSHIEENVI
jgi:hypothetical protein